MIIDQSARTSVAAAVTEDYALAHAEANIELSEEEKASARIRAGDSGSIASVTPSSSSDELGVTLAMLTRNAGSKRVNGLMHIPRGEELCLETIRGLSVIGNPLSVSRVSIRQFRYRLLL